MHLSGQLSDWSITDLLQIMQVTNKTGSLDIDGQRRGRVHFREGRVTGAELTSARESFLGSDRPVVADIIFVLSTMDEGKFAVGAADGPDGKGWSVEEVLNDVEALRSLEGEIAEAGLFEAGGVQLVQEMDQPVTIDPEDWHVFASLVEPFTFGSLESVLGRGNAVRIFHTLHRLGMAQAVIVEEAPPDDVTSDEAQGEWLDRVAGDLVPAAGDAAWLDRLQQDPPDDGDETVVDEPEVEADSDEEAPAIPPSVLGVSAPASTTLTDGVYDEIRRLRSRVSEK